jgi:hypothetical protein
MSNATTLLVRMAQSNNVDEVHDLVNHLISQYNFDWKPVGGREGNYGLINIGSDPGLALIERVTNAVDAVIEREAVRRDIQPGTANMPRTPREAVETWFGIPSGRVRNLTIEQRQTLADNIVLQILPGSSPKTPTITIRDRGVGLTAALLPKTILSLGESNKIDKPYLAGAYGQGGSTTLAFSPEGTLFVSRRQPDLLPIGDEDRIAVTVARFRELDPARNKNGRYDYLVDADGNIPSISHTDLSSFLPGTSITHFDLAIPQYSARMTQITGSMWWLLQNALFDPVLPIWVEEHREPKDGKIERRTIAGNHSRLEEDRRKKLEHSDSVVALVRDRTGESRIRAYYWVVKDADDAPKRSRPIDSYVDPYAPVAYSYYGQTHGTEDRRFVSDRLSLPYLDKYLIIQIELDNLTPLGRRQLLSTTRDRLKQSALYDELRESVSAALAEDEDLIRLNDQRKEAILSRHSNSERERMRERFAKLMDQFRAGTDARVGGKDTDTGGRPDNANGVRTPLEPLPTAEEPSFLRIANVQVPIPVQKNRSALIRLESDAPDGYLSQHAHAKMVVASDPEKAIYMASSSDFRGGRSRLVIRPSDAADAGQEGVLTVFLFTPTDKHFTTSVRFRIVDPEQESTSGKKGQAQVQAPEPVPVHRDEWPNFGWDEKSVADVRADNDNTRIFVNMDNRHIRRLLQSGGYKETGVVRMSTNYLLYVALFAFLRHRATKESSLLSGAEFDQYVEAELDRAAQTVVHSISAVGRLEE